MSLSSQESTNWIEYLSLVRGRLDLPKVKAPFDLVGFINQTRDTFSNPVVQAFQTSVKIMDKDSRPLTLKFPQADTIGHIKVAQDSGNFLVLQVFLEASAVGVTAREALDALTLLEIYKTEKPRGFTAISGKVSGDSIPGWCSGILANWIAQNGDIEMSRRSKKRKASSKPHFYEAELTSMKKEAKAKAKK